MRGLCQTRALIYSASAWRQGPGYDRLAAARRLQARDQTQRGFPQQISLPDSMYNGSSVFIVSATVPSVSIHLSGKQQVIRIRSISPPIDGQNLIRSEDSWGRCRVLYRAEDFSAIIEAQVPAHHERISQGAIYSILVQILGRLAWS
ncbi:hypothetical protein RRG08_050993 [Elysia crispata]|uniref:Uncharacterized protein n=1 Tax=Elysia crispata TaxID=231223 RepID=A0AAE0YWT3_9GAST|nr:hypothetical protein RRG08_050993 [Elysia crispata]